MLRCGKIVAMFYPLLRRLFFTLDPETAHGIGMTGVGLLNLAGATCLLASPVPPDPVQVMGLSFPNPVGLAAGLDKNGDHIDALAALGFGSIEIGTVTPRPQPGNPRPRLFRIPERQAIINRMGFNNDGVDKLLANVAAAQFPRGGGILGINIGKNFDTPIDKAADDYLTCLDRVYDAASYVTVNISSPNTKNLRELQRDDALDALLGGLKRAQARLADRHGRYVPLALKIAPDLDEAQIRRLPTCCGSTVWMASSPPTPPSLAPESKACQTPSRPAAFPARRSWRCRPPSSGNCRLRWPVSYRSLLSVAS
jgi:dihydroorotate dehydrogenase